MAAHSDMQDLLDMRFSRKITLFSSLSLSMYIHIDIIYVWLFIFMNNTSVDILVHIAHVSIYIG